MNFIFQHFPFYLVAKLITDIYSFSLNTYSSLQTRKLLNFQRPRPLWHWLKFWNEHKTAEWSVLISLRVSVCLAISWKFCLTISWKFWEIKRQYKCLWVMPEKCCCLKVYCFALGFRIRQILHKFNFSLMWSNLLSDCFFRQVLPPFASNFDQKTSWNHLQILSAYFQ